ncbi:glycoside hydrolase [Paenibacillus sp. N1-5-1-14]|uniref:glycoside hydrolase n=1 Tax=Paenibacillus radicibacter TaxID=2972488 RepID=UPI002159ACB6|nr:glycoside hydrolase [Paenibacillus radicibacter]MCR8644813.1 glycoside hydrolase [Paenibacillus radicibacter]
MKKKVIWTLVAVLCASMLTGCTKPKEEAKNEVSDQALEKMGQDFTFDVNPETFDITIEHGGVKESASLPLPKAKISDYVKEANKVSWSYPNEAKVTIEKKKNYLDIQIDSLGAKQFMWPQVSAESYTLPLWEGKKIPSQDPHWKAFLKDEALTWIESFSMNFFALNKKDYALMYIVDNPFNNELEFDTAQAISFKFNHKFPSINEQKSYGFKLFVTDNDPVQIAKLYRSYMKQKGEFVTLEDKVKDNPDIAKLFGAPHIYLWNDELLREDNIKWELLRTKLNADTNKWISELLTKYSPDGAQEFNTVSKQAMKQDYLDRYQKRVLLRAFNQLLKLEQLYQPQVFTYLSPTAKSLVDLGVDKLSEQKLYELNKELLKSLLSDAASDVIEWGKSNSTAIVADMKKSGINRAWVGLPNWANGLMNPAFVDAANKEGYLIGPYDSYHSIQEKEDKSWNTAYFKDASLYENATVSREDGTKVSGFLGRGRKLNPTLSMPSVKQRLDEIMKDDISFNSWFIDCDATGEIYDDYSPDHITTQSQDLKARLARMNYIAKDRGMVVGSEGGNDLASTVIAFAHGIETPVIKWGDEDMRKNKESEYFVGAYYSSTGGIPERYSKQVPIKDAYKPIYIDPTYSVPLFKLVYNDSVITTHHWEWDSLKIKGEVGNRMLQELLYNVPPMYHLDPENWEKNKAMITDYLKVWAPFHEQAVKKEMTGYQVLSKDGKVQIAMYGNDMSIIANFSDQDFDYKGETIKAKSALISSKDGKTTFEVKKYN